MDLMHACKTIAHQLHDYGIKTTAKNVFYRIITRERHISLGKENPDKTIYIIRSLEDKSPFYTGPIHNLLANYFYVLSHIAYARQMGWTPVVDQLHYPVYNSEPDPVNGTWNAWEYYWDQPGGVSLDSAYQSAHVVLSKQSWFGNWDMGYDVQNYQDESLRLFYYDLSKQTRLNTFTQEYVRRALESTIPAGKRILGVNVRIGGHSKQAARHGAGHPIQPELGELVEIVRSRKKEWKMDLVFLACETEHVVKLFKDAFGDELIIYRRERAEMGTEYALDSEKNIYAPSHRFQTTLDYLTEMELLSHCSALIGSVTSGFRYAVVKNGNRYEHLEVLDRGRFSDGVKRYGN